MIVLSMLATPLFMGYKYNTPLFKYYAGGAAAEFCVGALPRLLLQTLDHATRFVLVIMSYDSLYL